LIIKEEDSVERLVLGAGGHVALTGQAGQEVFELLTAGKIERDLPEGEDVMA
jgi:hypothetical protein